MGNPMVVEDDECWFVHSLRFYSVRQSSHVHTYTLNSRFSSFSSIVQVPSRNKNQRLLISKNNKSMEPNL